MRDERRQNEEHRAFDLDIRARQPLSVECATAFDRRLESMPEVPTVSESGLKGFSAYEWNAIFAPAGTPAEVVKRMETEMRDVLATPAMRERLAVLGALPAAGGAKELGEFVRAETAKWAGVIKTSQIKVD